MYSEPNSGRLGGFLPRVIAEEASHWRKCAWNMLTAAEAVQWEGGAPHRVLSLDQILADRMLDHYREEVGEGDTPIRRLLLEELEEFPFIRWAVTFLDTQLDELRREGHPGQDMANV